MLPYISIFGWEAPMYGLMCIAGIAAVAAFVLLRKKRLGIPNDDLLHIAIYCAIGALVGAKALYIITILPAPGVIAAISKNPALLMDILQQGFVFYGGLLGALFMMWLYCRKYKADFEAGCSLFAEAAPLFHVFGRIGCFFAGCCYGIESRWGIAFHDAPTAPNGVPLLPVQLVEAALNALLFAASVIYQRKKRPPYAALKLYLASYAAIRFTLEYFRGDAIRGRFLIFSTSQWIALAVMLTIAAAIVRAHVPQKRR